MINKNLWRNIDELNDNHQPKTNEFSEGADELKEGVSRRSFLKLMGASVAFAGLSGCDSFRKPTKYIRPYAKMPEEIQAGRPLFYSSAMELNGDVIGTLIETYEGRPTKIEGHPNHINSKGKSSVFHQASILNLYDPDRASGVSHKQNVSSYDSLKNHINNLKRSGKKIGVMYEGSRSPSFHRLLKKIKRSVPNSKIWKVSKINNDNQQHAMKNLINRTMTIDHNLQRANVIVSLDSDFLASEFNSVKNTIEFSANRSPEDSKLNRLYMFEDRQSVTGAKADHRFDVKASDMDVIALQFLKAFEKLNAVYLPEKVKTKINIILSNKILDVDFSIIEEIVKDCIQNKSRTAFLAGFRQTPLVHAISYFLNDNLKSLNNVVLTYRDRLNTVSEDRALMSESIDDLIQTINQSDIDVLLIIGGNPYYTFSGHSELLDGLDKVEKIHLSEGINETSKQSEWVVARSHYLEAWGDLISKNGVASIVQPVIYPLRNSVSDLEFLSLFLQNEDGNKIVRKTWRVGEKSPNWSKWLQDGIIYDKSQTLSTFNSSKAGKLFNLIKVAPNRKDEIELSFSTSYALFDGSFSNNGWLQEMPDPITKLTWDNALLVNKKTADKLRAKNEDVIQLSKNGIQLELPLFICPTLPDNMAHVSTGYGREICGRIGEGKGVNVYPLMKDGYFTNGIKYENTGKKYKLATTQTHGSIEGRPFILSATTKEYEKNPKFAKEAEWIPHSKSSWQEFKYDKGYQWGMSIDLSKCTACNVCVTACQSENNIPIVGKDEVMNGREMHWIRIDRYFEGEKEKADKMISQPVTCLQCENAPCEQVCPVAATVHTDDGLNAMTYNRCIGTRYCANNCPVKVRRFNFFDYNQRNPQAKKKDREHFFDYMKEPDPSIQKQFNPDVTVRMRGIMEKCTFCVQRINEVKILAKNERRSIKDGEIKPACGQACPTDAIVFGDINNKDSRVSKARKLSRDYEILKALHLKSRLTYLAVITNPNPQITQLLELKKGNEKS